jgi:hypothetical protein
MRNRVSERKHSKPNSKRGQSHLPDRILRDKRCRTRRNFLGYARLPRRSSCALIATFVAVGTAVATAVCSATEPSTWTRSRCYHRSNAGSCGCHDDHAIGVEDRGGRQPTASGSLTITADSTAPAGIVRTANVEAGWTYFGCRRCWCCG